MRWGRLSKVFNGSYYGLTSYENIKRYYDRIRNSIKIGSALVSNVLSRSQRNFAHVTTVTLSWRVQNFVVVGWVHLKLEHCKFWSNFEFDRNIVSGTGTWWFVGGIRRRSLISPCKGSRPPGILHTPHPLFHKKRSRIRNCNVFFNLSLNKPFSKQSGCRLVGDIRRHNAHVASFYCNDYDPRKFWLLIFLCHRGESRLDSSQKTTTFVFNLRRDEFVLFWTKANRQITRYLLMVAKVL